MSNNFKNQKKYNKKILDLADGILNKSLVECNNCPLYTKDCIKGKIPLFGGGNHNAKIMFVFNNPGPNAEKSLQDICRKELKSGKDIIRYYDVGADGNGGLFGWIRGKKEPENGKFYEKVFGPIEKALGQKNILNESYFTEAVKCADKKEGSKTYRANKARKMCRSILEKEIDIIKPSLIICFGRNAFDSLKDIFGIENIEKYGEIRKKGNLNIKSGITKLHGYLFKTKIRNSNQSCFIMPLAHYTGQGRNSTLRDSYTDYLKEGITEYQKATKTK